MAYSIEVDKVLLDQVFTVEHRTGRDHKMIVPHFHDGFEIHYTLNDDTQYYVDGKKYIGEKGSVAIFNSQEIHKVVVNEGVLYERYYIHFKPHFLELPTSEYTNVFRFFMEKDENVIHLSKSDQAIINRLFDELIAIEDDTLNSFNELKLKIKLLELVLFINDFFTRGDRYKSSLRYEKAEEMKEVIQYIKSHYSEEISLEVLSNEFFIAKSTLNRMFKKNIGMTPHEYIGYVRIIESRKLLLGGHPIKSVAMKVGYGDDSTFIKKFKSIQGITPKQYVLHRKGVE